MDLCRWAAVPSDLPISTGSSTSVNVLSDRQQLAVTMQNGIKHKNERTTKINDLSFSRLIEK